MTGSNLIVGTATGLIQIYDIASHQLLRALTVPQAFPVTHVETFIKPAELAGSLTLGVSTQLDSFPNRPISSFHRTKDPKARKAHEVPVIFPDSLQTSVSCDTYVTHIHANALERPHWSMTSLPITEFSPNLQARMFLFKRFKPK